jgi:hypothetical protein
MILFLNKKLIKVDSLVLGKPKQSQLLKYLPLVDSGWLKSTIHKLLAKDFFELFKKIIQNVGMAVNGQN